MKTTINDLHIQVNAKGEQRVVFMNNGDKPYFMAWNKGKYRWEFINADTPYELKANENEISNFILLTEKKNLT